MARLLCIVLLLTIAAGSIDAEYCTVTNGSLVACTFGCCGTNFDECCNSGLGAEIVAYYNGLAGAAIAGIVIGSLFALALIIGCIVLVVYLVNSNCCDEGNQGIVFSNNACANPLPVTSVNIAGCQPSVSQTRTTYQYPQKPAHNAQYNYM